MNAKLGQQSPIVDVDCSKWESDIPEEMWSIGKLVNVGRAVPAANVGAVRPPASPRRNRLAAIQPQELVQFLRRWRFVGGRVRSVRVRNGKDGVSLEFRIAVREAIKDLGTEPKPVRLKLVLGGVEEFRLQMRPNQPKVKIADARIAHLNGQFWITFDSLGLAPSERAEIHDFRASELFAAGRTLEWQQDEPEA